MRPLHAAPAAVNANPAAFLSQKNASTVNATPLPTTTSSVTGEPLFLSTSSTGMLEKQPPPLDIGSGSLPCLIQTRESFHCLLKWKPTTLAGIQGFVSG